MVSVKNVILVTMMFAKGCGALPGAKINAGCGTPSKNPKLTDEALNFAENSTQKPLWLGAVMTANYSKGGLFDTPPEQWKFTEPRFCSGIVEFFKEKDRYWVRMATSRGCALTAKQATPLQTLKISSESAVNLGFEGYLSINIESPTFPQIKTVLKDSLGKLYEPTRTVFSDAGADAYPYLSFGSKLKKETELLRLACHNGVFIIRTEKSASPVPEECLPAFWMETFRHPVAQEDVLKYQKELDILVAATSQLKEIRKKNSQLTQEVTSHLDSLIDSYEKFQNAQVEVLKWAGPVDGLLDCPEGKPCTPENRKNAFDLYIKSILPEAAADLTLLRDDSKSKVAKDSMNKKIDVLVATRNDAFNKLLEGLKLVSPSLKEQEKNLSILSHHMTTPVPKVGAVKFKMVPLFSKDALPEMLGVKPSFDAGRLFLKFDTMGANLRNPMQEGSAVMLGNYPITFLRVKEKQSEGAALMPLPERKIKPTAPPEKSPPQAGDPKANVACSF